MTKIHLLSQSEKLAPVDPWGLKHKPLYHQVRTFDALAEDDLVINAYNTGTGKTIAALLQLFRLQGQGKNVLFIVPTNALLHQHAKDIHRFVLEHDLGFLVAEVHASKLRAIMEDQRPGETLQRLIQNPLTYATALGLEADDHRKRPMVLVVNPDIFYYALYFRYGTHDQRNVFEKFLTAFDYIVIDEFHYYDSKQLANFLFFFIVSQQFGYFEHGRRICLLSATPNYEVLDYLDRVFGDNYKLLTSSNEPEESWQYSTTPVLTDLELEVMEGDIHEWASGQAQRLAEWLDSKEDGALISSALWRINAAYTALRRTIGENRMGRITGPEPEERRNEATGLPLILATPTVDIGYNFEKRGKERQNIDFLICDAHYRDELLQRLGRAGRVLGKPEHGQKSHAVALLSGEASRTLFKYDGQTLSRAEFAEIVGNIEELPPKQTLYAYIRTHAIAECFYPIYQMERIMPDHLQDEMDALYERVCEVFAPGSQKAAWSLRSFFKKYYYRKRWLKKNKEQVSLGRETAEQVADWIQWREDVEYQASDLEPHLDRLLAREDEQHKLRDFVSGQVHLTESLFAFRDSFQGPMAVVYDKGRLLSSEVINSYSLLHIVSNYRVRWFDGRHDFVRAYGETDEQGDIYGVIEGWREPRLMPEVAFKSPWRRQQFDERVCRRPTALRGLRLAAREREGDPCQIDPRIAEALVDQYVTVLGVTPNDSGVVYGKLRGTPLYSRRLVVTFPNGQTEEGYRVLLGTQAFQAHAELQGYFWMKDRLQPETIII